MNVRPEIATRITAALATATSAAPASALGIAGELGVPFPEVTAYVEALARARFVAPPVWNWKAGVEVEDLLFWSPHMSMPSPADWHTLNANGYFSPAPPRTPPRFPSAPETAAPVTRAPKPQRIKPTKTARKDTAMAAYGRTKEKIIRFLRDHRGWHTQRAISEGIGLTVATVSVSMTGKWVEEEIRKRDAEPPAHPRTRFEYSFPFEEEPAAAAPAQAETPPGPAVEQIDEALRPDPQQRPPMSIDVEHIRFGLWSNGALTIRNAETVMELPPAATERLARLLGVPLELETSGSAQQ